MLDAADPDERRSRQQWVALLRVQPVLGGIVEDGANYEAATAVAYGAYRCDGVSERVAMQEQFCYVKNVSVPKTTSTRMTTKGY